MVENKLNYSAYPIHLLSVLHQNKALYNFRKRWQRSLVERNIGLEYAMKLVLKRLAVKNGGLSISVMCIAPFL